LALFPPGAPIMPREFSQFSHDQLYDMIMSVDADEVMATAHGWLRLGSETVATGDDLRQDLERVGYGWSGTAHDAAHRHLDQLVSQVFADAERAHDTGIAYRSIAQTVLQAQATVEPPPNQVISSSPGLVLNSLFGFVASPVELEAARQRTIAIATMLAETIEERLMVLDDRPTDVPAEADASQDRQPPPAHRERLEFARTPEAAQALELLNWLLGGRNVVHAPLDPSDEPIDGVLGRQLFADGVGDTDWLGQSWFETPPDTGLLS
jgi:hypothetical protein